MENFSGVADKMKINLLDETNTVNTFFLEREKKNTEIAWKYDKNGFAIEIITDIGEKELKNIRKSANLIETEEEIRQKFLDALFEYRMNQFINSEDGFDDAEEEEEETGEKYNPYDPKLIRVDTKTFSISHINEMINRNEIDLSPDFQRGFVWTDITRKSRLIESLLLRIPIPVFYFSQDEDGLFQVVDGVQRLTVINSFMKNEFKLKNLEYLSECNGKYFKSTGNGKNDGLESIFVRRIEQTQLFINIIDPQTPGKVKYDIFKRINTGGKALNNQEIRNCLANGRTRGLLRELSESESFLRATRKSISPTRMADEELILRFISFYLIDTCKSYTAEYRGGMDSLLDETVDLLNTMNIDALKEIRDKFLRAMDNAFYLFGSGAFRKANYINKALFLGVSRVLCRYSKEQIDCKDREEISARMQKEISDNYMFRNALSMATNDARNVRIVYETVKKIIGE